MSAALDALLLQHEIDQINAAYAAALDERRFDDWPEFFAEEGSYILQARENHDRGLPLALMSLESRGMMRDRVYGIQHTIYHSPYYTRHVFSPARILSYSGDTVQAEANYAIFRTRPAGVSEVFSVGRMLDTLVRADGALKFKARRVVYDSEMVLNSVIYPV